MSAPTKRWFIEDVARRKLKAPAEWEPAILKRVGETADCLIEGGIPRVLKRGPNKGDKRWPQPLQSVVVTADEIKAEEVRYEVETGKCSTCQGSGEVLASISIAEGAKYRLCKKCLGSGVANKPLDSPA